MKRRLALMVGLVATFSGLYGGGKPLPRRGFTVAVVSDFHMALDKLKNAFADLATQQIDTMVIVGE